MPRTNPQRDLIPWMKEWMQANDLTAVDVARDAGYSTNSPISMVLRGEKTIPLDRLDDWARGLKIFAKEEREHFDLLARLATCPPEIRKLLWSYHDRLESLSAARANSKEEIASMSRRLQELEHASRQPRK